MDDLQEVVEGRVNSYPVLCQQSITVNGGAARVGKRKWGVDEELDWLKRDLGKAFAAFRLFHRVACGHHKVGTHATNQHATPVSDSRSCLDNYLEQGIPDQAALSRPASRCLR